MDLPLINTVREAEAFLRTIGIEVIGIWRGWILHDAAGDFERQLESNAELIEQARYERDMSCRLCAVLGVDSLAAFLAEGARSAAADGYAEDRWPAEQEPPPARGSARPLAP